MTRGAHWRDMEIARQRLIERRRGEIAGKAKATLQAFREGCTQYGTVDDLLVDIDSHDGVS